MKVIISLVENGVKKHKLGEFDSPKYASQFVEAVLSDRMNRNEYIRLYVECAEEDK